MTPRTTQDGITASTPPAIAGYVDGKFPDYDQSRVDGRFPKAAVHVETERDTRIQHTHYEPYDGAIDDTLETVSDDIDTGGPPPSKRTWHCWIGEVDNDKLPPGSDNHMREEAERAFEALTGQRSTFTFSGWGAILPEKNRAVVEHRLPDPQVMLSELESARQLIADECVRRGLALSAESVMDWRRRNGHHGDAPDSWQVNDFMAMMIVKMAEAIELLNVSSPDLSLGPIDRRGGREAVLTAAMIACDCWDRYSNA